MLDVLGWTPLSQRRQEVRLILFYKSINVLAQVPFEGVLVEAYKGTRIKPNIKFRQIGHTRLGHTGTLAYSSFRWKGIRLFNSLPMHIRNITACPPLVFKKQLDLHLSPILDCPCTPNFNNSLDNKY